MKSNLLEALEGFSDATTNLRQLLRAENKGGDASDNHQLGHTKSEHTITRETAFFGVGRNGSVSLDEIQGFECRGEEG